MLLRERSAELRGPTEYSLLLLSARLVFARQRQSENRSATMPRLA